MFDQDVEVKGEFTLASLGSNGTLSVSGNADILGQANIHSHLSVSGATTLANTLSVAKHTHLSSTLSIQGNTTIREADFTVSYDDDNPVLRVTGSCLLYTSPSPRD